MSFASRVAMRSAPRLVREHRADADEQLEVVGFGRHQQHSGPHVEGPPHLGRLYAPQFLHKPEYPRNPPGTVYHGSAALGQNPGQVAGDASPGDVGKAVQYSLP